MNNNHLQNSDESDESKLASRISSALESDSYGLPSGFADSVIRRVDIRKESLSGDYAWIGIGLFLLLVAAAITAIRLNFSFSLGAFKFLSGYGSLIIFALIFIAGLQWFDKNFVQKKLHPEGK